VLLAEPSRTQFDLNFSVLGFPVRVHPFFWLVGVLLGFSGGADGMWIIVWLLATFVSILIHELGHALMIRRFGREAHIVLYAMGGLAIEGRPRSDDPFGNPWESYSPSYSPKSRTPGEQILISAAGPGIQLLLAGLIVAAVYATGGRVEIDFNSLLPVPAPRLGGDLGRNINLFYLVWALLYINIFWALMNLLPVLPLDGGQISLQVLAQHDPWGGMVKALWLSVFTAGAVAVAGALVMQDMFLMILFGSLALSSFMTIQQMGGGGGRRPW
jgi:Zn-dependent protease